MTSLSPAALSAAVTPPGVERIRISGRNQWLALRQQDVTASVAGALFGVHEYQTALGLWMLKSGRVCEDAEETPPMRRGRLLEPVALQLLAEERPDWSTARVEHYYRDPAARLGATPDAFAIRDGKLGVIQIKTVEAGVFRRKWTGEDRAIEPPLWIAVQALVEAALTGASWAAVVALVPGFGLDLHVLDVPLTDGLLDALKAKVAEFWASVDKGEPPPADYARDGAMLAALYAQDAGKTIDLTGDNRLAELAMQDAASATAIKEHQVRRAACKAELIDKMRGASVALFNGAVFATAKTVHKKPYAVAASSYLDVRFKNTGAAA